MSTVEKIEYYSTCPSCGASSDGSGTCAYCGSSMIKNRIVTDIEESLEDSILKEDAGLPVVRGKNGKVNSFLKIFCPIFGGMFIGVPTIIGLAFTGAGFPDIWLFGFGFLGIFYIIGIGALIPLFRTMSAEKRCKNGKRIIVTVRGYENSNVSINGTPTKIIRVRTNEDAPHIIEFDTGETKRPFPIGSAVALRTDGESFLIEGPAS